MKKFIILIVIFVLVVVLSNIIYLIYFSEKNIGFPKLSLNFIKDETKEYKVVMENYLYGYINRDGKYMIEPTFISAHEFSDGLALVQIKNGKYGYINNGGEFIIQPIYNNAVSFSSNAAIVLDINNEMKIIDKQGKVLSTLNCFEATPFVEELSIIKIKDKYGAIDINGKTVINPKFDYIKPFSENIAVFKQGNYYGYINKLGDIIINPQFLNANDFIEDKACVKCTNGLYGYINKEGLLIINPQYDFAYPFKEGIAVVVLGNKFGVIDDKGKYLINPQYDNLSEFEEGRAAAFINGGYCVINRKGKTIINPNKDIQEIKILNNIIFASMNNKIGILNSKGDFIVSPRFNRIDNFENNYFVENYNLKTIFSSYLPGDKIGVFNIELISAEQVGLVELQYKGPVTLNINLINNIGAQIDRFEFNIKLYDENDLLLETKNHWIVRLKNGDNKKLTFYSYKAVDKYKYRYGDIHNIKKIVFTPIEFIVFNHSCSDSQNYIFTTSNYKGIIMEVKNNE